MLWNRNCINTARNHEQRYHIYNFEMFAFIHLQSTLRLADFVIERDNSNTLIWVPRLF
jgi:hypothetical protein